MTNTATNLKAAQLLRKKIEDAAYNRVWNRLMAVVVAQKEKLDALVEPACFDGHVYITCQSDDLNVFIRKDGMQAIRSYFEDDGFKISDISLEEHGAECVVHFNFSC